MSNRTTFGIILIAILIACQTHREKKHLFFFHNRFLEEHHVDEEHPIYGRVEYRDILKSFSLAGFEVHSEQRKGNINARDYAQAKVLQIEKLLNTGTSPKDITIVGTSKGGYIAQYVSTIMQNADLNFVFVASYRESDIENIPEINFCGNILTIHERSDPFGVSALRRKEMSTCEIKHFKEIELNTGLDHGFLFKASDDWIIPTLEWANGKFHRVGI